MSITATTLAAACSASDLTIKVASATGATIKNLININGEYMIQTEDASGTVLAIGRRGQEGTYNQAHASGSVDFPID